MLWNEEDTIKEFEHMEYRDNELMTKSKKGNKQGDQ